MEKIKCLWCNALKDKNELNVIYGKNAYFNKSIFYGCGDNNHIEKIKKFLEHTEKYYSHAQSSIKMSLILYPLLMVIFK
ncbi:MAG TPA: hypothetical protein PLM75_11710, partial [bacterium]|nr:hypothetical protein [bacterium]